MTQTSDRGEWQQRLLAAARLGVSIIQRPTVKGFSLFGRKIKSTEKVISFSGRKIKENKKNPTFLAENEKYKIVIGPDSGIGLLHYTVLTVYRCLTTVTCRMRHISLYWHCCPL